MGKTNPAKVSRSAVRVVSVEKAAASSQVRELRPERGDRPQRTVSAESAQKVSWDEV
jgi:hypothetical protein